jgi:hypothetical protein
MESIQNSAEEKLEEANNSETANELASDPLAYVQTDPLYKYSAQANDRVAGDSHKRVKRARENPNKKKSCSLYIQTDPLFWRHIRKQVNILSGILKLFFSYSQASILSQFYPRLYC